MSLVLQIIHNHPIAFYLCVLAAIVGLYLYRSHWLVQPIFGLKLRKIVSMILMLVVAYGLISSAIMMHRMTN